MNLIVGAPTWLVGLLGATLLAAALEDWHRQQISNLTCLAVLVAAVIAMVLRGFPTALWQNLLVFTLILSGGTFAFAARLLGGGDVKLLAALGLWVDLKAAVWLIAIVFIAGGAIALLFLVSRIFRRSASAPDKGALIPYGLAITAGSLVLFAFQLSAANHQSYVDRLRSQMQRSDAPEAPEAAAPTSGGVDLRSSGIAPVNQRES